MKINSALTTFRANKMTYNQVHKIEDALTKSKSVDILCHDSSDQDTVNSALLMWNFLYQRGIESRIILSQDLNKLHLRKNNANIIQADEVNPDTYPDTVLCVDFSAEGKMHKNTKNFIDNARQTVCIDHHDMQDLFGDDVVEVSSQLNEDNLPQETSLHYIDTTAKSATSVVYRFFEATGEDITHDMAYEIMLGLVSDSVKKGIIECDGNTGEVKLSKKFKDDKNAFEVYSNIRPKLSSDDMAQIAKNVDIMSSLTEDEQKFADSLYDRVQYAYDGTIAYVVIPRDNEEWNKLGGDNPTTSTIINRFRQSIIKDTEKYPKTNHVIVFYPSGDMYRLSLHSRSDQMRSFYKKANSELTDQHNEFSIGGHRSRGGGKIIPSDDSDCQRFIEDILQCLYETEL